MSYILGCIFLLCLVATGIVQYQLAQSKQIQYEKSRKLLVENPDDFVRREAFFKDAYAYYNVLHVGAFYTPYSEVINRLNTLNCLTQNRMNRYMHIGCSTKIGSDYYLSKSLQTKNVIGQIKRKILNVCSSKKSGASIIDMIVELREDRIEIMPILAELQEENLIVPRHDTHEILYTICQ
jgi:hypothetical protein